MFLPLNEQIDILKKGTVEIIPEDELVKKIENSIKTKKPLTASWNQLLAGGVISVMPLLLIFVFLQRYIIENSINSGIKG